MMKTISKIILIKTHMQITVLIIYKKNLNNEK